MTEQEQSDLARCEHVIERGLKNFVEVGSALLEVNDQRLYRQTHDTFQLYCRDKWKMSARRAYQLCEAAEVVKALPPNVNNCSQITNEAQARELAKVPPEHRADVLQEAAKDTGKPTARSIKSVLEKRTEPRPVPGAPVFTPHPGQWITGTTTTRGCHCSVDIMPSVDDGFFFVNAVFSDDPNGNGPATLDGTKKAFRADAVARIVQLITDQRAESIQWTVVGDLEPADRWRYNEHLFNSHQDYMDRVILGKEAA